MTLKHIALLIITLTVCTSLLSQDAVVYSEYTDERDSKIYETVEIGGTTWIAENMKFKTDNSEEHFFEDSKIPHDGYYYPLDEISQVCPDGYRIPNSVKWEHYIKLIYEDNNEESIEISRLRKNGDDFSAARLHSLHDSLNLLQIKNHGHTQNGQIVALGSFNMWITYEESKDPKYHLHFDDDGFSVHTHKHHIIDKKKKIRKFSIRCVKGVKAN